ncbi:hypothetical protein F511_16937 [Dorcoceras hygrometricum]|uniref:Uncharacterized protein n=1 Tax=Dorcoceras hygrometricum TaxID=472368 RepID=A0A2Z7C682_9LAMI|nr:hypothetical protein F511_16937 [Dorcoceras hygrometricum]
MQSGRLDEFPPLFAPPPPAAPPPKPPDDEGSHASRSYAAAFADSSPRTKRKSFMEYGHGEKIQAKEIVLYKNTPGIQFSKEEVMEMEQAHPFALAREEKPAAGDLREVLNQKRRKDSQDKSNNTGDGKEEYSGNVWREVGRNRSGVNQKEVRTPNIRQNNQEGHTGNRFDALGDDNGSVSGADQDFEVEHGTGRDQMKETGDESGKEKNSGSLNEAHVNPSTQNNQERRDANRFDTVFDDKEYVSDDELDADNHEGEEHAFMAKESSPKDPVVCPSNQHALNVERNLLPPIPLQPFCVLNKAQSSLESRHSQHSNQVEQEMDDNYQVNINTLPAIEMAPNIISRTIIEPLEDEGEENIPEADSSEDKTLEEAPKQILQRSLSAGNLKQKGHVIIHRMATRSHTRSQGTSSSQSFQ